MARLSKSNGRAGSSKRQTSSLTIRTSAVSFRKSAARTSGRLEFSHTVSFTVYLQRSATFFRFVTPAGASNPCEVSSTTSLGGRAAAAFRPTRSRGGPLGIRSVARAACIPVQAPLPHVSVHVLPHFLAPRRRGGPQTGPLRRCASEMRPLAGSGLPRRGVPKCGATRRSPDAAVSRRSSHAVRAPRHATAGGGRILREVTAARPRAHSAEVPWGSPNSTRDSPLWERKIMSISNTVGEWGRRSPGAVIRTGRRSRRHRGPVLPAGAALPSFGSATAVREKVLAFCREAD